MEGGKGAPLATRRAALTATRRVDGCMLRGHVLLSIDPHARATVEKRRARWQPFWRAVGLCMHRRVVRSAMLSL
eukprot:6862444-Pyramimonas_sp.AAC.1